VEAEAKSSANGRLFKLYFIHATSPCTVASDIHVVQVVSINTSHLVCGDKCWEVHLIGFRGAQVVKESLTIPLHLKN
jgi:hypothetical protein